MSQLQLYNLEIPAQAAYRWQMYSRYGWHQAMLAFFADSEPKTLLWHRQSDTVFGSRCTVLTDGRIISTGNLPLRVKSKVYPLEYLQHDVYRFAVELSPRREEMHTHRKRSVDVELLPQWFRERSAGWGFETLQLSLDNQRVETFVRRNEHILMQEAVLHDSIKYPPIDNRNDPPRLSKEVLSHAKKKEDHGLRCVQQWRIKNHDQTRRKSEDPAPDTR